MTLPQRRKWSFSSELKKQNKTKTLQELDEKFVGASVSIICWRGCLVGKAPQGRYGLMGRQRRRDAQTPKTSQQFPLLWFQF